MSASHRVLLGWRRRATWRWPASVVLGVVLALPAVAPANDQRDHERARQALLAGEILSLRAVLDAIERDYPGDPIEIEFERDDGRFVYEIKLLQANGRILELDVDAATGRVLDVEGDGRKGKGQR